jgi:urease accessory protein
MRCKFSVLAIGATLFSTAAAAHHPTGNVTPATLFNGLLSGLGHPVIGLDHLAFIVGVGIFACVAELGMAMPLLFVAFMAAGLALHLASVTFPGAELLIALSAVAIGLAIIWYRTAKNQGRRRWLLGSLFAAAGTVHGYAFGESIVGAETGVLAAYVLGLIVVQMSIATTAYVATRAILDGRFGGAHWATRGATQAAGLAIMSTGALFAIRASGLG